MKVLTFPYQCTITEYETGNTSLGNFPKGNKYKYCGEFFMFKEKYFTNVCIMTFQSKTGKTLIFKGLPKYIEI